MKKKVLNTDINKLNWRFNQIFFSDHKLGYLLYVKCCIVEMVPGMTNRDIYCMLSVALSKWFQG